MPTLINLTIHPKGLIEKARLNLITSNPALGKDIAIIKTVIEPGVVLIA